MPRYKNLEERYSSCLKDGFFQKNENVNTEKIKSLITNAQTSISSANIIKNIIKQKDKEWMSVYIGYYEALRIITEAFILFDKIKIANHQCLFVYLCTKHTELELNCEFFDKVRTKRHGINYYGEHICYEDWKAVELQFNLYINILKKEIEKRLNL